MFLTKVSFEVPIRVLLNFLKGAHVFGDKLLGFSVVYKFPVKKKG